MVFLLEKSSGTIMTLRMPERSGRKLDVFLDTGCIRRCSISPPREIAISARSKVVFI
jgi:hypothetical protein